MDSKYWVMDGRARYDIEKALVLSTCSSLEEAKEDLEMFGDAVIVDVEKQEVVYD